VNWRQGLFDLIDQTPNLDWLLLTKRPENIEGMWIPRFVGDDGYDGYRPNVWLGTSVEDQDAADTRIPHLLKAAHLARFAFLSCEPLLGPIDLHLQGRNLGIVDRNEKVSWVIAGGESGHGARPMHWQWVMDLRDQCATAGVPFLFKQWGEWGPVVNKHEHVLDSFAVIDGERLAMVKMGKHASGRMLKGIEHNAFPS